MTLALPAEGLAWHAQCGKRIKEIEPRLAPTDCAELAATLWQLDCYQSMSPEAAAERFMTDNLCADADLQSPWWQAGS